MTGRRALIVGGGMIAEVHRRAVILAGAEVVGVVASSQRSAADRAAAWHVPAAFDDLGTALAAVDADTVHICTPNATHHPFALTAIAAGKDIVLEKPVGTSVAQAQEIADAAAEAGVRGTVPFVYRFHPLVREIRARRLAGEFGDVTLLHGSYLQDWMLDPAMGGWRVDPTTGGASRAFADIGSHWCDLVEWVSGERFQTVTAATGITVPERPDGTTASFSGPAAGAALRTVHTEDVAVALLRSTRGVLANVTVSQVSAGRKNRLWFELDGTRGSAVFDQENPETVWLGGAQASQILQRDPGSGSAEQRRLSSLPAGHAQGYAQCFENFVVDSYRHFAGAQVEGLPTLEDGVRSAHVVSALLASRDDGAWNQIG